MTSTGCSDRKASLAPHRRLTSSSSRINPISHDRPCSRPLNKLICSVALIVHRARVGRTSPSQNSSSSSSSAFTCAPSASFSAFFPLPFFAFFAAGAEVSVAAGRMSVRTFTDQPLLQSGRLHSQSFLFFPAPSLAPASPLPPPAMSLLRTMVHWSRAYLEVFMSAFLATSS